jgi:hypothetical protein
MSGLRSRTLGIVGAAALIIGAGVVVASPASAAPVADVAALRAAVTSLNGTGPAAEIELAPGVVYSLPGGKCADENNNAAGDLDIHRSQALKIFTPDGKPPAVLEMTCPDQRIIDFGGVPNVGTGSLTLRNLVLRNGHAPKAGDGGNIGGAVRSLGGDLTVQNVLFENNSAGDGPDGTANDPQGGFGGFGGAILALGRVTIDGSTFKNNKAGNGGKGFGGTTKGCDGGDGGQAGAVLAVLSLTITNSTFTGNTAGSGGNGADGRCAENDLTSGAGGAGGAGGAVQCGVLVPAGRTGDPVGCSTDLVVRASTFSGNAAGSGGNGGSGRFGGAGGAGGDGGAIHFVGTRKTANGPTSLLVENSTVDGNTTGNGGTGGDGETTGDGGSGGKGGGVAARFATRGDQQSVVATLVHATVTENGGGNPGTAGKPKEQQPSATAAAQGVDGQPGGGGVAMFDPWSSISTVIGTSVTGDGPDCWRKATDPKFSVSTDADTDSDGCGFGAPQAFAGFALATMAGNGGPTQTRLPGAASTLIDKVSGVDGQLTVDQRGVPRPQGTASDIGAVEVQLIDMTVTKTASASTVTTGTKVTFTIAVKGTGKVSPQPGVTLDDPKCTGLSTPTGDANTNGTLDPGETFTYTCTATPTDPGTFTNTATATVTDAVGQKITRTGSVDVTVTAADVPILASTGTNNPLPELLIGATLVAGGAGLIFLTRQRRIRIRPSTKR